MASTTNLNLTKLTGTEKQKTFPSTYNDNMDAIDGAFGADFGVSGKPSVNAELNSLGDGLAILANGNTHAAITSGQFVYVRGHGTLADGLYQATSNIAKNGTLSGSNLTDDSSGGLNTVYSTLNSNIVTKTKKLELTSSGTNLDSVLHAWMETHRGSMSTGEMACTTGVFNNTIYYGLVVKVSAKVMVGTMFTPASSNGFRFRDSSDDSEATHVDFTL